VVKPLSAAYDQWWTTILPDLVNEDAYKTAPKVNPFKEEYWKQFRDGQKTGTSPE
jgi:arylsulfatase